MGFESLSQLAKTNSGRLPCIQAPKKSISISLYKSKKNAKGSLSIRIQSGIMNEIRYAVGDRVDVLIDRKQNLLLIKRITSGGYKISAGGSCKKLNNTTGSIQITPYSGFPSPAKKIIIDQIICTPDGILCELPADMEYVE